MGSFWDKQEQKLQQQLQKQKQQHIQRQKKQSELLLIIIYGQYVYGRNQEKCR